MCISSVCRHRRVCTLACLLLCCFCSLAHQCSHRLPGACVVFAAVCGHRRVAGRSGGPVSSGPKWSAIEPKTPPPLLKVVACLLLLLLWVIGGWPAAPPLYGLSPCQLRSVCDQRGSAIEPRLEPPPLCANHGACTRITACSAVAVAVVVRLHS